MLNQSRTIICPVCTVEREIPTFHLSWIKLILVSLGLGLISGFGLGIFLNWVFGIWGGALIGGLSFLAFEVYYIVKFRRELRCPMCYFDPYLYKQAPERAKKQCEEKIKNTDFFKGRWQEIKEI